MSVINAVVTYKYAMILDDDVMNIGIFESLEDADRITKVVYGDKAYAVDIEVWPVGPGFKYINNTFYASDGKTLVPRIPTPEETCNELKAENEELTLILADLIGGAE